MSDKRKPEKVIRDGMVAVLVSPGYGGGWSTWSSEFRDILLFDRRLVEAAEAGVKNIDGIVSELTGGEYVYTGGWIQIEVEWVPEGTQFTIDEYDGFEQLRTIESLLIVA